MTVLGRDGLVHQVTLFGNVVRPLCTFLAAFDHGRPLPNGLSPDRRDDAPVTCFACLEPRSRYLRLGNIYDIPEGATNHARLRRP